MDSAADGPATLAGSDFSSLFEFLPVGAYRSTPDGRQLRANPALVRINGFENEADQLAHVHDIANHWYVQAGRREEFKTILERDGRLMGFESEIYRYRTRERVWVRENAHVVRAPDGSVLFYEGTVEEVTDQVLDREALRRSQLQLRQIVDLVPGVIYRVVTDADKRTRVGFISPNVAQMFGVSPEAVAQDPVALRHLRHPDDRERVDEEIHAAGAQRRALDTEFRIVRPDGRERWIHQTNCVAPSEDGCEVRVGLMLDITARKQAEADLLENSALWKRALESTGDGVWDWNLQTGVETLSAGCLALYGYGPDDLQPQPDALDGITHPDDLAAMAQARAAHFAGRVPAYVNEHRVRCKNGHYKWVLSRGVVISRSANGTPLRMIGTHTDIDERKQADALRFERDHAAAADLAKSQFLSRVSHELRTPLNAILGFTQLLELEPTLTTQQRGWVVQVLSSGRHLLALMDDILDLSSVQTGQFPLHPVAMDLHATVQDALAMLGKAAQEAGVDVRNRVPPGAALRVRADARRLQQIVSNLLSNAIKYNQRGGWAEVSAVREGSTVALSVADSGQGLSDTQVARLFKPFERAGAHRGPVAGTGLGLALTREFAQAMGGSVGVSSQPGLGSTFVVRLPAA
jgi:PAS domain S-box-containing protein